MAALHGATGGYAAGWQLHLGCVALVAVLYWRMAPASYAKALNLN
jgi:CP family cyanate transporter-like MFS transporter